MREIVKRSGGGAGWMVIYMNPVGVYLNRVFAASDVLLSHLDLYWSTSDPATVLLFSIALSQKAMSKTA